jgi:Caspase domain
MATRNPSRRSRRAPGGAAGGSQRALLVAINDYGNPQNDLPSCLQDAAQFRSMLQSRYGFETFAELYDGDATVANVDAGLAWLFDNVGEDDRLVFFYSGHGYQQPRNGVLDECLVLSQLEFFFDDRLSELSQSAPPGVLTVVLDSCFSGGMEKRVPLGDGVEIARTKLWVPPPDASPAKSLVGRPLVPRPFGCFPVTDPSAVKRLVLGTQTGPGLKAAAPQAAGADEASQLQLNGLLLSACSENETALAATSTTEGLSAFTYALMNTLPASGEISVASLYEGVRARLAQGGFRQTPMLKAPPGPADLAHTSFVTLAPVASPAGQPAKTLPAQPGGEFTTTDPARGGQPMTEQQTYDQQFWRTVERVAAQVALAAGNQAPAGGKSFAPGAPPPAAGQGDETAGPTTLPAGPMTRPANPTPLPAGTASGPNGGTTGPAPRPAVPTASEPTDAGAAGGEEKWVGAALSIVGAVAPLVIDAFRKRPKDFASQDPERLAESVSEVVAPAIVDALARQPLSGDGADKFPWGAVARVVASAVPSIVAEITKGGPDVAASPAGGEQKGAIAAAIIGAAAWHAIAAWRGKDLDPAPAGGPNGAADDELSRAATRIAAEVVPAVVRELTGQNEPAGQKMVLPVGTQLPVPGRYYIM